MRVLAIVYCLPPLLVPAAMCYLKLILGLRQHGVDVEAVAIRPETFAAPLEGLEDPSLVQLLPSDLTVHWVRSPETHPVVRFLKRSDAVQRGLYRVFEPRKREWTFAARRVLSQLDLSRFDVVLTCSQPHANHLLGLTLKEWTGLPWVAYFSDPWTGNPYARSASARVQAYHRDLEMRVLTGADRVLFTSPEMERQAKSTFGELLRDKTGVVPHGYVPGWYDLSRPALPPAGPLRILHTGHFYGPRTPAPLLRALEQLSGSHDLPTRTRFTFYGSFPVAEERQLHETGLDAFIDVHGPVPYLDSLALMRGSDLLLVMDAALKDAGESVFLPSKLVDYLGAGKRIVAITPRQGATARVVEEVGGTVCDVDQEAIRSTFDRMFAGDLPPAPNPARAARYDHVQVAAGLLEHIEAARMQKRTQAANA
jgi:Glycosyl transferase 4-like domain